jgi:hypothetical protein
MGINVQKSMYNMYVESLSKIDKLLEAQKESNKVISELNQLIKGQNKKISEIEKINSILLKENEKLKNIINKDSSNSSKPKSTDNNFNIKDKPKKSGANLYNARIATDKKIGGQVGHKGVNLSKGKVETLIKDKKVVTKEVTHFIKGYGKDIIKYRLGIDFIPYVEIHTFKHTQNSKEKMPKEFKTDVTYAPSLKAICIELGTYNVVPLGRLTDFISIISNGVLSISEGSICNFNKEFSDLSKESINNLINDLKIKNLIYTDETPAKVNKKQCNIRNYSDDTIAVYKFHEKKGHKPIIEDDILTNFTGSIMADHDLTIYSYGSKNCDCNSHLLRYLEELIQNVPDLEWPLRIKSFLLRCNNSVKVAKLYKLKKFDSKKIKEYISEYDNILTLATKQNNTITSTFYKEKAIKLYNRLIKYKDNHLYFINDFTMPFSNNLSERDLRVVKTKTKISSFRSKTSASYYADALTIIKTSVKRQINPFTSICDIFNKKVVF